ncbi:MAG: DUF5615 family PIN-like protein [Methylococcaceae bacterium]|jgi:predicted nuclease of predicted toxin-antitoxin system
MKIIPAYCAVYSRYLPKLSTRCRFLQNELNTGQPPKIIWLKIGNQSKTTMVKTLRDNRQAIESALLAEDKTCIEII